MNASSSPIRSSSRVSGKRHFGRRFVLPILAFSIGAPIVFSTVARGGALMHTIAATAVATVAVFVLRAQVRALMGKGWQLARSHEHFRIAALVAVGLVAALFAVVVLTGLVGTLAGLLLVPGITVVATLAAIAAVRSRRAVVASRADVAAGSLVSSFPFPAPTRDDAKRPRVEPVPAPAEPEYAGEVEEEELPPARPLDEVLAELDALTGLAEVKRQVRELIAFTNVQRERVTAGLPAVPTSNHLAFVGPPGTGKTSVARLLAETYRSMGLLERGQLVEVDRAGLVGEYLGHTEAKTNAAVDRALGGMLFIDEAYALAPEDGSGRDFGKLAIDVLVKRLEDDRSRFVCVLAGYAEPMRHMLDANEGLRSRIGRTVTFESYSARELVTITRELVRANGYELEPRCEETMIELFAEARAASGRTFGNARYARSLFEGAMRAHATRIGDGTHTERELRVLTPDDWRRAAETLASTLTTDTDGRDPFARLLRP